MQLLVEYMPLQCGAAIYAVAAVVVVARLPADWYSVDTAAKTIRNCPVNAGRILTAAVLSTAEQSLCVVISL